LIDQQGFLSNFDEYLKEPSEEEYISTQDLLFEPLVVESQLEPKSTEIKIRRPDYLPDTPSTTLDCFNIKISKLSLLNNSNLWQICIKLVKIGPIEQKSTNIDHIKYQDLILSDSSGQIRLTLLDDFIKKYNYDIDFLKIGKIYKISGVRVRRAIGPTRRNTSNIEIVSKKGMKFYEIDEKVKNKNVL